MVAIRDLKQETRGSLFQVSSAGPVKGVQEALGGLAVHAGKGGDFVHPGLFYPAYAFEVLKKVEQPLPERRAEIQPVMQIFGLDENIGVQQVTHSITPSCRAVS